MYEKSVAPARTGIEQKAECMSNLRDRLAGIVRGLRLLGAAIVTVAMGPTMVPTAALSQDALTALTQVRLEGGEVQDLRKTTVLRLPLGQPVPYRMFTLDAPMRLVIDFSEVDWVGFDTDAFDKSERIEALRVGGFRPGWSRMVLDLAAPLRVSEAVMRRSDKGGELQVVLEQTDAEDFRANAGVPDALRLTQAADPGTVEVADPAAVARDALFTVVLDPGHGGIDPGAEYDGIREADAMLGFARELKDVLLRAGGFEVILTRNDDNFVPLETRITIARHAQADVFLSLHADAISEGHAEGATIYTLADRASDAASQKIAERHDRADILSGVDLTGHDDVIAGVLQDLARTETTPRTESLAQNLVTHLSANVTMHKRPRLEAGFSVLKAADIPSVLIEVGFLSSAKDRERLSDSAWRTKVAWAIRDALLDWRAQDAQAERLKRK